MTRRRMLKLGLTGLALLAIAAGAWAYWTTQGSGTASATAGTLNAPMNVTANATATTVAVDWTGSTLSNGTPAQGYYITRTNTSTSATSAACGSSSSSLISGTSCSDTSVPNGSYTYKVTAVYHTWTAPSAASSQVTVQTNADSTPPSISTSFPTESGVYRSSTWSAGCSPNAGICGTASDPSGVTSVEVSILRASTNRYWDGSGFNSTSENFRIAVGTTSWHYDLTLPPDDDYTVHVRATDGVGNTTSSLDYVTRHFTSDATSPTIIASGKNADNSTYTAGTWTKQTVTVHYTCSDPTVNGVSSGLDSCSSDQVFSSDTNTTASGTATDNAGNSATATFAVKVDKTAPTNALSLVNQSTQSGPAGTTNPASFLSGNSLWYSSRVAGSFKLQNAVTDSLSGPASSSYAALAGTTTGWSFTASTVSTPSGGPYGSNELSWGSGTASQPTEDVTGADTAGNMSPAATLTFKNDGGSPIDTITSPVANADYTNATWDASFCSTGTICGTSAETSNPPIFGTSSSAANASGGASTLVLSKPTSVATNDVLIAAVTVSAGTSAVTSVPSGWTQIATANQSSNIAIVSYYHVVTNAASEPSSYSWGLANSTRASGGISRYAGVDTSSPIDVSGGASGNNSASVQTPSVATTADNDLVVGLFSLSANTNFTPPSGTTERYDVTNTSSTGPAVESADYAQTTAGSTGTKTATAGTSGSWAAQLIALKRAPSGGSNTSGLARVQVSVQATSGASSGKYWDPAENGGTGGFTSSTEMLMLASGTTNWSLAFPSTNFTDANYTVRAYAVDNVGNYTTSPASTSFTVENTAPTTTDNTASIGSAWRNTSTTVTLTPSDAGTGVAATYYTTDGSAPTTSSSQGTSISITNTGVYTIKYFSVDNAGNQEAVKTASTQIRIDKAAPTSSLALGGATGAFLSGSTLYYKSNASGSFTFVNSVTDADSGPASTTFPAISTTGWTHNSETVGGASPYTSNAYSWSASPSNPSSRTITSTDVAGNTSTRTISFSSDTAGPTGGAVTVNGTAASAAGSTSVNTSGSFSITTLTQYSTDGGSGAASSSLVREEAALNADGTGTCSSTWTNPTSISGATPISQTGTTGTCYRYTLTGTDNVGNSASISTVVKVDTTGPTTPALSITANGSRAYADGTTVYYNGTTGTSSSFTVSATSSDPESGIQKVNFPALTSFTGGGDKTSSPYSSTYTWTSSSDSGSKTVTAYNGLGSTATKTFSLVRDVSAPTAGALTVNGVAATSGGSTSTANTDSFAIDARTNYDEAQSSSQSGFGSSTLTVQSATLSGGTCGAPGSGGPFTSPTTISGTTQPSGVVAGYCYRYTLTGTDNVGNTASISTAVKVDTTAPTTTDNTASIGSAWRNTSATVTLTPSDAGSGVAATYYTTDGSTPTTSSAQGTSISLINTGVYTIKYFSVDNAGNQEAVETASTQIRIDKAAPTSSLGLGSATGAYLSGTTLYYKSNAAGSFTFVNAVTDADSGPASTTYPAISTTGWAHNAETVSDSSPYTSSTYSWSANPSAPSGKTITSTDLAGNTSTRSVSFTSDTAGPTGGAVTVNGTAASAAGTTSVNTSGTFSITTLTQYTDGGSGLASSSIVREQAALNADGTGTCSSTWTNPTTISGATPISQTGTDGACYRYTLTGTDNVGNSASISTIVKVDTTGPTTPALAITTSGNYAYANGTTVYYNGTTGTSSSFTVSATTSDPDSGIQKVNFPVLTSFTGGGDKTSSPYSSSYTWTSSSDSGAKTVTAYNGLGGTATGSFSLTRDVTAPTAGALTVNGVAASSGGSTSTANTDSFAIDARTNYDEAQSSSQSGLASNNLTIQSETLSSGGTCGAPGSGGPFTSPTTISGTTQPSGIVAGYCYLYTLTGTDKVGNADSVKTTVAVTDAFQLSDPGARAAGTAFNVTITAVFNGATDTSYTGSKTITFTGPGTSPAGTAPSYPASVTFTNGVGTAGITLYKAETTALTATQGTITGTSPSFTVNPGSAAKITWTSITTNSPGTPTPNPCYFTCTYSSGFGNGSNWSANTSITDNVGNIVSGVGSGHNVTVTFGGSKNGTINGVKTSVTLTIPATGAATSTTQLAYLAGGGSSWTDTLSAASSGFTSAAASFSK